MNFQEKVKEFMIAGGQFVATERREMTEEERVFRHTLLQEEINELKQAIKVNDRVEILDALCDIKVVNDGTANTIGLDHEDDGLCEIYEMPDNSIEKNIQDLNPKDNTPIVNYAIFELAYLFDFSLETFKEALNRVHDSNMSKFCKTLYEADLTLNKYHIQNIDAYHVFVNGLYVVKRRDDNKILKSINYHAVDLTDLV